MDSQDEKIPSTWKSKVFRVIMYVFASIGLAFVGCIALVFGSTLISAFFSMFHR